MYFRCKKEYPVITVHGMRIDLTFQDVTSDDLEPVKTLNEADFIGNLGSEERGRRSVNIWAWRENGELRKLPTPLDFWLPAETIDEWEKNERVRT